MFLLFSQVFFSSTMTFLGLNSSLFILVWVFWIFLYGIFQQFWKILSHCIFIYCFPILSLTLCPLNTHQTYVRPSCFYLPCLLTSYISVSLFLSSPFWRTSLELFLSSLIFSSAVCNLLINIAIAFKFYRLHFILFLTSNPAQIPWSILKIIFFPSLPSLYLISNLE